MILILTGPTDPHADLVQHMLREHHAEVVRFNPAQFPAEAEISIAYAHQQERYVLHTDEGTLDLANVRAVWYRRPDPPLPHKDIKDEHSRHFLLEECNFFLQDLWHVLDCLWLPARPSRLRRADLKASQLKMASSLGFELPPTLVTNSPSEFIAFYNEYNGQIISKLAGPPFLGKLSESIMRFTQVVTKREVGYAHAVQHCPTIFQAYVPKRVELRITVVGQQVFAAEIHSQSTNHTRHDWRRYDHYKTLYFVHDLPREVQQQCVQLVAQFGLCYGAIDMIVTPDGRYVFLEINPNGQYLWVEQATGLPISEAICDLLLSGPAAARSLPGEMLVSVGDIQ